MNKVVCLYGGPGTGKSTTAADLFQLAKKRDINAELCREYVKNWVWEGREIKPGDQIYIAAKQSRAERVFCFGGLDLVVTDSPVLLSVYYEEKYDSSYPVCRHILKKHEDVIKEIGYSFEHIFLNRVKAYNPEGRFQTEDEAKEIDTELRTVLDSCGIKYSEVVADENAGQKILDLLGG